MDKGTEQKIEKALRKEHADELARLLYRIFKESYPKITLGGNKNEQQK